MNKNELRSPKNDEIELNEILEGVCSNPLCQHPKHHQIEDSGHVWQYCRGKNCHRQLLRQGV